MTSFRNSADALRRKLEDAIGDGMQADPIEHAKQVAIVASVLRSAFAAEGIDATLVGGSAIEVHAPGIHRSGDLDLVVERGRHHAQKLDEVFLELGFLREGRHWRFQDELFVEVVPGPVAGPTEDVRFGDALDKEWLEAELRREGSLDALHALARLAASAAPVDDAVLRAVIDEMHRRSPNR